MLAVYDIKYKNVQRHQGLNNCDLSIAHKMQIQVFNLCAFVCVCVWIPSLFSLSPVSYCCFSWRSAVSICFVSRRRAGKLDAPYWTGRRWEEALKHNCNDDREHKLFFLAVLCVCTISFSLGCLPLWSRYCLLSSVMSRRKPWPLLRSANRSLSSVSSFCSNHTRLSALLDQTHTHTV